MGLIDLVRRTLNMSPGAEAAHTSGLDLKTLGHFGRSSAVVEAEIRTLRLVGALDQTATSLAHPVLPLYSPVENDAVVLVGAQASDGETVKILGTLTNREVRKGQAASGAVVMLPEAQEPKAETMLWADKDGIHYDPAEVALPKIEEVRERVEGEVYDHFIAGDLGLAQRAAWQLIATIPEQRLFGYAALAVIDRRDGRRNDFLDTLALVTHLAVEQAKAGAPPGSTRSKAELEEVARQAESGFFDQVEFLDALIKPAAR